MVSGTYGVGVGVEGGSRGRMMNRATAKALPRDAVVCSEVIPSWSVEIAWWCLDSDHMRSPRLLL